MLILPGPIVMVIGAFAPMSSKRIFAHVKLLVVGAILAPGKRTVTSVLRVMGGSPDLSFQNYHRVMHRAQWSTLHGGHIVLRLLLRAFVPTGPVVIGVDETIERRRGEKIAAKGIYRDPVRSSHTHVVKASGLRWVCLMLLAPIPWTRRIWALPCLTVLSPQESARQFPLQHLMPVVIVNQDGKVIERKPSIYANDPDEVEAAIRAEMFSQAMINQGIHAQATVEPAREQINSEHQVEVDDFLPIVSDNPFVPEGREYIYARGLHAGLTGDFHALLGHDAFFSFQISYFWWRTLRLCCLLLLAKNRGKGEALASKPPEQPDNSIS
jgi:DDE superfamily endonuclease